MNFTNNNDIPIELAVWLLHDEYDYVKEDNYISATGLMKPIRHILLPSRIPPEKRIVPDVEDFIAMSMGTSLHAGIEKAWKDGNHVLALRKLGYPDSLINRILVNPTAEELAQVKDPIPIYQEQRAIKEFEGYKVGGKFDMVAEGRVTDFKSTSVWSWVYGGRDEEHRLQGSIYRWLNQDIITEDYIRINYIFTDWSKMDAGRKENYPPRRVMAKDIPLMSIQETENWIRDRLNLINKYKNTPEKELPECTEEELWMSAPQFKYYSDPSKASVPGSRSTKNFDNLKEASLHLQEKGKGVVITVLGTPKRCGYCPAFPICTQKDKYNL